MKHCYSIHHLLFCCSQTNSSVVLKQILSVSTVCPLAHIYNFQMMHFSFKSNRKKRIMIRKVYLYYILCVPIFLSLMVLLITLSVFSWEKCFPYQVRYSRLSLGVFQVPSEKSSNDSSWGIRLSRKLQPHSVPPGEC